MNITDRQRELIGLLVDRMMSLQASAAVEYISETLGVVLPRDEARKFCIACHAAESEGETEAVETAVKVMNSL